MTMAKKRKRRGKGPDRRKPAQTPPDDLGQLPDRRILEGELRRIMRGITGEPQGGTPLDKAQALLETAYQERNDSRRVAIAKDALTICPDCADAYVLLAENAQSRKEAFRLYEKAVAAGEKVLGPKVFEESVGHFWGLLETRPYMRAREGLANILWTLGRREESVQHLQELLRLNPGDNQGNRFTLASCLFYLDRDAELAELFKRFPDDGTAAWAYNRALLAFRQQGDNPESRALLKEAQESNPHIPNYLLGRAETTSAMPPHYTLGSPDEARIYVQSSMGAWRFTPGARAWLRANDEKAAKRKANTPVAKGPLSFVKKWLRERLPQGEDIWQVDFRPLPTPVRLDGEMARAWITVTASLTTRLLLSHAVQAGEPSGTYLWDLLVQAMQNPNAGTPHRPTQIQVRAAPAWESLRTHFQEIGVELIVAELEVMDALLAEMIKDLDLKGPPGLLDMPGMRPEHVASFYDAAYAFYRQAPWKKLGYESTIRVECDKYHGGPWYGVAMGQTGFTVGLSLYEDLKQLRRLFSSKANEEENARQTVGTAVTFGDELDVPLADVEAAKKYGWKVAGADAYPLIIHKERGLAMRPPLVWQLELMDACLRVLPEMVQRRRDDDSTPEKFTVPMASGELHLTVSWVGENDA